MTAQVELVILVGAFGNFRYPVYRALECNRRSFVWLLAMLLVLCFRHNHNKQCKANSSYITSGQGFLGVYQFYAPLPPPEPTCHRHAFVAKTTRSLSRSPRFSCHCHIQGG
jgi:hypothetical protein